MAERRYSISQAGRLVGVENHVLRYWEDELHLEIPRDRKNQRYYTKLHIEMFQKINELKEKGYQLKAIEPVLKRMLAGEKNLDLNEVLRQNAAEILRQARLAGARVTETRETAGAGMAETRETGRAGMAEAQETGRAGMTEAQETGRAGMAEVQGNAGTPGGAVTSLDESAGENVRTDQIPDAAAGQAVLPDDAQGMPAPAGEVQLDPETVYHYAGAEARERTVPDSMKKESVESDMDGDARTEVAARTKEEQAVVTQQEKLEQFQRLMNHIIGNAIGQAMRQNNEALSEEISRQVNDRMVQELEYMMRISDEKEEERFKALDETLRAHQKENKGKAEAAAARMPFFRRKKFGRSGKKL